MKRIIIQTILAVAILTSAGIGNADEIFNKMQPDKKNVVYATFGMDPAIVTGVGYARGFDLKAVNRMLGLSLDVSFPIFAFDFKHYKLDLGSRIAFFDSNWNIINRFGILNKGTSNAVYTGNLVSLEEGLLGGYFADNWFIALEANFEIYLLTHMEHTDYYREIYADVKDGWYSSTGGKWRFALQGGYNIKGIVEPTLRVGTFWHAEFSAPVMTMPLFAELAVNVHF